MATGAVTSDGVELEVLRTRQIRAQGEYDKEPNLKSLLTVPVWQDTLSVYQSAKLMRKLGSDSELATMEKTDVQTITIPEPTKYGLAYGIHQDALKKGITSLQVMQEYATALDADRRLVNQLIMKEVFVDGGWWDASAAPPRYGNNTMTSAHDHYLAYSVSGVPALAHIARAKRHIREHGVDGELIAMFNGEALEKMEVQAEWVSAAANKTPLLNELQIKGITPSFYTDGVLWVQNDYCPLYYGFVCSVNSMYKPLAWRYAFQPNDTADGIIRYATAENEQYYKKEALVRWGAVAVQMRSLGVPIYLNHGTYTAPTVSEWDDI